MLLRKKHKNLIIFIVIIIVLFVHYPLHSSSYLKNHNSILKKSPCYCRANENIELKEYLDMSHGRNFYEVRSDILNSKYTIDKHFLKNITCDMTNVLRRGPNQKVIGFSLYGKDKFYYNLLKGNLPIHI